MRISIHDHDDLTPQQIADGLRKAAVELSPLPQKREGSKRFRIPAGRQIFEHFDKLMKQTIDQIKKDVDLILGDAPNKS